MVIFFHCMDCPLWFVQCLEREFLQYINNWECTAQSNDQCTSTQKKMCLSEKTIEGLRITGIAVMHLSMMSLSICHLRGHVQGMQ